MNRFLTAWIACLLAVGAFGQAADPAPPARVMALGIGQDRAPSMARTLALGQARSRMATQFFGEGFTWNRKEGRVAMSPVAEGDLEFLKTERYLGLGQGKVLVLVSSRFQSSAPAGRPSFQVSFEARGQDAGEAYDAALANALARACRERLPQANRARGRAYAFDLKAQGSGGKWRVDGQVWVLIEQAE